MNAATKSGDDAVGRLVSAYRCGQTLLLLFDYDGTLVPIMEHPRDACLGHETRQILETLSRIPRIRVGIVSGRAIDDLKNMVGIKGIDYVGTCGLELEFDQIAVIPRAAIQAGALVRKLVDQLKGVIGEFPKAWIEQKPLGLTVHFRQVSPGQVSPLRLGISAVLESWGAEWCQMDGPMAIEIIPNRGLTKGTAVHSIMGRHTGYQVCVLYAGDAANDAEALDAAITFGGIAVSIGERHFPRVQYRLPDPNALSDFLRTLLDRLNQVIAPGMTEGETFIGNS